MIRIDRISKVINLLNIAGGRVDTRKKVHKTIYLLQALGEDFDYDYTFHYFGVFSPSLAYDLDFAEEEKYLTQNKSVGQGFIIESNPENETGLEEFNKLDDSIEAKAKLFLAENPQLLEALSTIVYLAKKYYRGTELDEKFLEVKPKLEEYYANAKEMAKEHFGNLVS